MDSEKATPEFAASTGQSENPRGTAGSESAPLSPPPPPVECDLVMQGGITSGVAYPAAIMELYRTYRFRSIGGASAGAIAAAITAAAEYARDTGGFQRLDRVRADLRQPGKLVELFQPTKEARSALRMLLAAQAKRTAGARASTFVVRLVLWLLAPVLLVVAAVFCVGAILVGAAGGSAGSLGWRGWLVFAVILLVAAVLALVIGLVFSVARLFVVHLPSTYYGMCLGKAEGASTTDALADWLHKKIQYVAGKDESDPLTFADLAGHGVALKAMTTDLSLGQPVRMPDHARFGTEYLFSADELAALFPETVVRRMEAAGPVVREATDDDPTLRRLPADELPILVPIRMSLAFPALLASVPLWSIEGAALRRHWIADGGITSNFPIHFFDAWLPTRPTFGINFVPRTRSGSPTASKRRTWRKLPDAAETVGYYPTGVPPRPLATIAGLGGFVGQVIDAMHNWHDAMQAELPGFSDRIAHIALDDGEGGFNITMPPDIISRVERKGAAAGRKLAGFEFRRHWVDRYAIAMRMLQRNLAKPRDGEVSMADSFGDDYRAWLIAGAPGVGPPRHRDPRWCAEAGAATQRLLTEADGWLPGGVGSFVDGADPMPPSTMRITPDV